MYVCAKPNFILVLNMLSKENCVKLDSKLTTKIKKKESKKSEC